MRRLLLRLAAIIGVLVIGCLLLIDPRSFLIYAPRYGEAALKGKTPAEVVRDLGPPDLDPRQSDGWKDETTDGPLALAYHRGTMWCTIWFEHGHVVSVRRNPK